MTKSVTVYDCCPTAMSMMMSEILKFTNSTLTQKPKYLENKTVILKIIKNVFVVEVTCKLFLNIKQGEKSQLKPNSYPELYFFS